MQDFKPSTDAPQGQSPLLEFDGTLDHWEATQREFTNDDGRTRTAMSITFNFTDVDVIRSLEPYVYPIATINLPYSPPATSRGGSRWDAYSKSLRNLMPYIPSDQRLDKLVGQRQRWAQLPAKIRVRDEDTQQWGEAERDCWQVVSIDGVGQPEDLTSYMAGVADGKTEQEFHQALLTDPKIQQRTEIVTSITNREVLPTLIGAKLVTRDNEGVLHRA